MRIQNGWIHIWDRMPFYCRPEGRGGCEWTVGQPYLRRRIATRRDRFAVCVCGPPGLDLGIWGLEWEQREGEAWEVEERCLTWRGQGAPMTSFWCASTCGYCCWRHWKEWLGRISGPCHCLRDSRWRTCCPSSTTMSRAVGNRRPFHTRQAPMVEPARRRPSEPPGRYRTHKAQGGRV